VKEKLRQPLVKAYKNNYDISINRRADMPLAAYMQLIWQALDAKRRKRPHTTVYFCSNWQIRKNRTGGCEFGSNDRRKYGNHFTLGNRFGKNDFWKRHFFDQ
jgi:hypothetical protein